MTAVTVAFLWTVDSIQSGGPMLSGFDEGSMPSKEFAYIGELLPFWSGWQFNGDVCHHGIPSNIRVNTVIR